MKSILGLAAALGAAVVFAVAYFYSARPGATWLDGQWIFLAALPYNWVLLRLTGESGFTPDSAVQVAAAGLFDVLSAFLAGALTEAAARTCWRASKRLTRRA